MGLPTPPLHEAPDLGGRATSSYAVLTPRRRWLATRRAARLREYHLPVRLALAQDSPYDGQASADYVRTLDELWELERRLEDAPRPVRDTASSIVQTGHRVTVEFNARRLRWRWRRRPVAQYLLVQPAAVPLDAAHISVESPLAQAILGHTAGTRVQVNAPLGHYFVRILSTTAVLGER